MNDPQRPEKPRLAPATNTVEETSGMESAAKLPPIVDPGASALGEPEPVEELSPEEQMARFEKELKENDWGHQPC